VRVGRWRSREVGLGRRLQVTGMRTLPRGRVRVGLRTRGLPHRRLVLGRQTGCTAAGARMLRRISVDRSGRAELTLPRPRADDGLAVYRVWSAHRMTYSPPIVVRPAALN
jgi:hypothetical protein